MKASKQMLLGVFLVSFAAWMAAINGTNNTFLGGASIVIAPLGAAIFLIGFFFKSDKE